MNVDRRTVVAGMFLGIAAAAAILAMVVILLRPASPGQRPHPAPPRTPAEERAAHEAWLQEQDDARMEHLSSGRR